MNDQELVEAIRKIVREEIERFHLQYQVRTGFNGERYLHSLADEERYRKMSRGDEHGK